MSHSMEIYNLLIRYTKDLEGKDITLEELYNLPWWRCVWGSWLAEAYYKTNGFYQRIEDVPDRLDDYRIIANDVMTHYFTMNGRQSVQSMTKSECKSIYS